MCLGDTNFAMVKRNGEWVGTGYKVISSYLVKDGKIQWAEMKDKTANCGQGSWSNNWVESKAKTGGEITYTGKRYAPGFHIFLTPEHAQAYSKYGKVVKVYFKEVLAFGTNSAGSLNQQPCVIANWMKIVELHKPTQSTTTTYTNVNK